MTVEVILVASYFVAKAIQDAALSTGKGFNPAAKYAHPLVRSSDIKNPLYRWYHDLLTLKYKERFLFSGSFLVGYTDVWHFAGTMRHLSVFALIFEAFNLPILTTGLLYCSGLIIFQIVYTIIRRLA